METAADILKITIPALIVFFTAWILLRNLMKNDQVSFVQFTEAAPTGTVWWDRIVGKPGAVSILVEVFTGLGFGVKRFDIHAMRDFVGSHRQKKEQAQEKRLQNVVFLHDYLKCFWIDEGKIPPPDRGYVYYQKKFKKPRVFQASDPQHLIHF